MKTQIAAMLLCSSVAVTCVMAEDMTPKDKMTHASNSVADQVMPLRASQFVGMNIYNNDNKSVGEVKDIVFDGGHDRISYVAVSYGGLLGMGDKLYAVPYQAFVYRPVDKGTLTLNIDKETVKNMSGFDKNNWPDLSDPSIRQQMMDQYHIKASDIDNDRIPQRSDVGANGNKDVASRMDNEPHNSAAGMPGNTADRTATAGRTETERREITRDINNADHPVKDGLVWNRRYSQLKGANVVNKSDEKLGDVYDVVFNANNGKVNYIVLQRGGVMGIGDKLFAVPADAVWSKKGEEKLVLDISIDRLRNAPGFDQGKWPDFADPTLKSTYDQFYNPNQSTSTINEQKQ